LIDLFLLEERADGIQLNQTIAAEFVDFNQSPAQCRLLLNWHRSTGIMSGIIARIWRWKNLATEESSSNSSSSVLLLMVTRLVILHFPSFEQEGAA